MTLEQWRQQESLVAWAQTVFETPEGMEFLGMLDEENPKNYQRQKLAPDEIPMELGKIYGYDNCFNTIRISTQLSLTKEMPSPTFEPPEVTEPEKD